jgi:hypothetical protein
MSTPGRIGDAPRQLRSTAVQLEQTPAWVYAVEIAVGTGCLVAAIGAFRRRLHLVGVVLVIAALAAIVHGVQALAR